MFISEISPLPLWGFFVSFKMVKTEKLTFKLKGKYTPLRCVLHNE
jgi:hypothetical protein